MPKKTKKEKLLARQHRHLLSPMGAAQQSVPYTAPSTQTSYVFSPHTTHQPAAAVSAPTRIEYQFLKKDLIKTVVLTTAILISELLLTRVLPQ